MHNKRLFQLGLIVLLLISGLSVSAQEFGREDVRPFVRVTFGTRTDNYIYYTPDQPDYNRVVDVVDTALPIYTTMTGLPWTTQIVIVYMDTGPANRYVLGRMMDNSTAYVTRREPALLFPDAESCHLRIYMGWQDAPEFEALVARELFHCLQMSIGAAGSLDFADPGNTWWLWGTAEWAASRVVPSQYPQSIHSVFDPRQDITRARLDAYYFWEFASSGRGFGSDQNVITQMGVMRQGGLFPLNFGLDSTELFHSWAQVLLNRQLPNPPTVDLTTSDISAGRGGTIEVSMPRFAVDYKNLVGFDMQPGNIAFLRVTGMPAGHYAASVRTASGIQRVQDDTPFQFCPSDEGTMIILSRGRGDRGAPLPLNIEWGQEPSDTPCTETPDDEPDAGACIVGSWGVETYPYQLDFLARFDKSGFIFNFYEDGALNGTYEVHAREREGGGVDVNVDFGGLYQVSAVEGSRSDYEVLAFDMQFLPGGLMTRTDRGGVTVDTTDTFYRTASPANWYPDGAMTCEDDVLSWDAVGGEGFVLVRLP